MSESEPKTSFDLHQGLVTALACWLASVLAFAFHLDNPWWATMSAWIVANPEHHALLEKAANRILGTVVGCIASYWLALWIEGRPSLQTVAMFAIGATGSLQPFSECPQLRVDHWCDRRTYDCGNQSRDPGTDLSYRGVSNL